ncbi:MAG: hypothetical protein QXS20_09600 [Candidatus Thorarchaeota archaeon]
MQERISAVRVLVEDLVSGRFDKTDVSRVVTRYGVEVRRAVIVGYVVSQVHTKREREYASLTVDDGTETIQLKAWDSDPSKIRLLTSVQADSLVIAVGRVRQIGNEVYLDPEIVRELPDPNYLTLHRLERIRTVLRSGSIPYTDIQVRAESEMLDSVGLSDTVSSTSRADIDTSQSTEFTGIGGTPRDQVFQFIKSRAGRQGVSIDEIANYFKSRGVGASDVNMHVIDLLEERKIREVTVGVYLPA